MNVGMERITDVISDVPSGHLAGYPSDDLTYKISPGNGVVTESCPRLPVWLLGRQVEDHLLPVVERFNRGFRLEVKKPCLMRYHLIKCNVELSFCTKLRPVIADGRAIAEFAVVNQMRNRKGNDAFRC